MLQNYFPLSAKTCHEIEQAGTMRSYIKGSTLYLQGEKIDSVGFILSGLVCFWINTPNNDQLLLSILGPGTILGDVPLVDDGIRAYTCTTLEDCSLYSVPTRFMRQLSSQNLEFCQFLNQTLAMKLRKAMHSAYRARFISKKQRLADILIELSSVSRSDTLNVTQAQLGHMVGCSRPTIIAELKKLEEQSLIRTRYGRIRIEDRPSLHKIANHNLCRSGNECLL